MMIFTEEEFEEKKKLYERSKLGTLCALKPLSV